MTAKKIYIVRHGQTKFNQEGIVQGRGVNASLNNIGREQAGQFFRYYKEEEFEKVLISSLKRTYESVIDFIELGIPYEVYEGLDEISWGIHEGEKASELRNVYFKSMVEAWRAGDEDLKIEGGESPREVATRQIPVINEIKQMKEELILVCMHGRALRVMMCNLLELPLSEMDNFGHDNLGLYIIEFDGKQFKLLEQNSTTHLTN